VLRREYKFPFANDLRSVVPTADIPRYIILQLGLAGPILQISRTVLNEVRRIATDKLREAFAEIPDAQPVAASSNESRTRTADGMDGHGEEARRKGDLVGEKVLEK
jgi:hypothetical protein